MKFSRELLYVEARDAAHDAGALESGRAYDEARRYLDDAYPWLYDHLVESIARQVERRFQELADIERRRADGEQAFWAGLRRRLGQSRPGD
jgi:hypothetical protein